jgi:2-polyprenyl-3-methyl-5-hydroxy-6-metoxy-1,4-benzoquinol methylase/O-antigen/teichoic acid export membrane protein
MLQGSDSDRSFYLESMWMVFATVVANVFSFAVNLVAPWMTMAEYGLMATLLQAATLMMIPAMGLQAVFTMEGASCDTLQEIDELAQTTSAGLLLTGLLWLGFAAMTFHFRDEIVRRLSISNAAALWVTIGLGLPQLWLPILMGLLQGRQSFRWLGWSLIANGVGRFSSVAFIVVGLGGQATGAMTGILIGTGSAFAICAWHTRTVWLRRLAGFRWRSWLGQVLPLTLGLGSCQYMMSADMIFARSRFEVGQTGLYAVAGVFARGIVISTGPIVAVMFPKIVNCLRRALPTNALGHALKATFLLAGTAAAACTCGAWATPHLLQVLASPASPLSAGHRAMLLQHTQSLLFIARLIPWFVWSMLPLAVANVLVAYVVARRLYWHIASLGLVAALYTLSLSMFSGTMIAFIGTIGIFNLLFCLLSAAAAYPAILDRLGIRRPILHTGEQFDRRRECASGHAAGMHLNQDPEVISVPASQSPGRTCPACSSPSVFLFYPGYPGYQDGTRFDIYRCPGCDARFIDSPHIRANLYNSIYSRSEIIGYDRYARYASRVLEERKPLHFLASQEAGYHVVYRHLRNKSGLAVLDAGCGYGYLTYALRRHGFEAFGVDVSETAVGVARNRFGDYFYHSDIETFAERHTRRYDTIVAFELIEHLTDPLACLRQLLRLLAPGGVLLLTTPNRDFYRQDAVWHTELPPVHTIWLGRKGAAALAARTGCAWRVRILTDFYPKNENKLAKYLGCRRRFRPMPMMAGSGLPAGRPRTSSDRYRDAANWFLHNCAPVRLAGNILHNCFLRADETLALQLWRDDVNSKTM